MLRLILGVLTFFYGSSFGWKKQVNDILNINLHGYDVPLTSSSTFGLIYYVSGTNGNDNNNGTIDFPFATIIAARNAIRKLTSLPTGGVLVYIREGTYYNRIDNNYNYISALLPLFLEDSGTDESPIVYSGYPNEKVILSGGIPINSSYFETSTDYPDYLVADLTKMDENINWANVNLGNIANGVLYDCAGEKSELFVNNKRMWLSRWPNVYRSSEEPSVYLWNYTQIQS